MAIVMSDVAEALELIGAPELDTLQLIDAAALAAQYYPLFDPSSPALVMNVEGANVAQLQKVLLQAYPEAHELRLLDWHDRAIRLEELRAEALSAELSRTALYVPPLPYPGSYSALQNVSARLRAPDGCPWDRELTWDKLRPFLIEETYELLDALDQGDPHKVLEEEGDLLLQISLQAQIATEKGDYRFPEVVRHIVEKLIRRHPHVYGEVEVSGTDEVLSNWEAIKAEERAKSGAAKAKKSPLSGVPKGLPALLQAESYLDRMSRLRNATPPGEPWAPLANLGGDEPLTPEVLGQALFDLVSWAMARGVESESALRETNARYAAEVAEQDWG
jgi:tetrapyrrole methylase family protein / MazG family protein